MRISGKRGEACDYQRSWRIPMTGKREKGRKSRQTTPIPSDEHRSRKGGELRER